MTPTSLAKKYITNDTRLNNAYRDLDYRLTTGRNRSPADNRIAKLEGVRNELYTKIDESPEAQAAYEELTFCGWYE